MAVPAGQTGTKIEGQDTGSYNGVNRKFVCSKGKGMLGSQQTCPARQVEIKMKANSIGINVEADMHAKGVELDSAHQTPRCEPAASRNHAVNSEKATIVASSFFLQAL